MNNSIAVSAVNEINPNQSDPDHSSSFPVLARASFTSTCLAFALICTPIMSDAASEKYRQADHVRSGYSNQSIGAFTALKLDYNRFDNQSLRKSIVSLSTEGLRVADIRGSDDQTRNVYIQNFQSDMAWLVSTRRNVYVSLMLNSVNASQADKSETSESVGVMTDRPCQDLSGQMIGPSQWRGWEVEIWACESRDSRATIKQTYSQEWGMVIREETPDGAISELHNLKKVKFSPHWFVPDPNYREVDFNEFIHGVQSLTSYPESGHALKKLD